MNKVYQKVPKPAIIGSICRADNSGLGTLAREFYDNGVVDKVLIYPKAAYRSFPTRFPGAKTSQDLNFKDVNWLLDGLDTLLFFETPYRWDIIQTARRKGIKTVLMVMHEGIKIPQEYRCDAYLCPSDLEMELPLDNKIRLNVPVNTDRVKWKLRKKAEVFVHNAGHGGIGGRNGTHELIEAMKYVKSNIKLIIRSQKYEFPISDPRIEFRYENVLDYWDIWDEGDVFIFPEKFNGLSLPIQEAAASGMMIMSSDRKPMNDWLPKEPLLPVKGYVKERILREVEVAQFDPKQIAKKIDQFANKDISNYSRWGRDWALKNNWQTLKKEYDTCLKA